MIHYIIASHNPSSHIFNISLTIEKPDPQGQKVMMPAWIPGSYTIRDFAKHVIQIKAPDGVSIEKIDSCTWQIGKMTGSLTLEYEVYAWDRSVRGAHLDNTHAFMNLCCLCLAVVGQEKGAHRVNVTCLKVGSVATTLKSEQIDSQGFGWYQAKSYDELIDHPIEIGQIERLKFRVNNIPHEIAITGRHYGNVDKLQRDVQKICETHQKLFNQDVPFEKYCFLLTLVGEGYGGLEHRSSTALLASRNMMPKKNGNNTDYKILLGLFSHEYFHAWNVKRIKPAIFCPYDLTQSQHTKQLWAFEGFTAYYDDLALVRSGVITTDEYFQILSDNITKLKATPGQAKQTLVESSFDAWIKFYKPDENSPNSGVSYYLKGMIAALCFDMVLRQSTDDKINLDDLMRDLWKQYGAEQGVPEGEIERLLNEYSHSMTGLVHKALYTTEELDCQAILKLVGLNLNFYSGSDVKLIEGNDENNQNFVSLGIITAPVLQELQIMTVLDNSAAMKAGLSSKDIMVAIDHLKINNQQALDNCLMNHKPGDVVVVHVFREDRLLSFTVELLSALENKAKIRIDPQASLEVVKRREQWLV